MKEKWLLKYQLKGAIWIHDKNPRRPHALLTSGKHSNGFFNSRLVIPDEELLREAASDLLDLFLKNDGVLDGINRVVGPQTGATKLAEFVSDEIGKRRGFPCEWASPAKQGEGEEKTMVFDDPKRKVLPGEMELIVEDVITTAGSVKATREAVRQNGGTSCPFVLALVNRSGFVDVNGLQIVALIDHEMPIWKPEECPLCKQGSEAIRPKGENWAVLNVEY